MYKYSTGRKDFIDKNKKENRFRKIGFDAIENLSFKNTIILAIIFNAIVIFLCSIISY